MNTDLKLSLESQKRIASYESTIKENLNHVYQRIQKASLRLNLQDESHPRLIAVSKTHPPEAICAAFNLGLTDFGENYAQELKAKKEFIFRFFPEVLSKIKFSFIGRIQSNKIPIMVQHADEIQSVSSLEHAYIIDKYAQKWRPESPYPIWLLVNAGNEATKDGFAQRDILSATEDIVTKCQNLEIQGIMAIPPPFHVDPSPSGSGPYGIPPLYQSLKALSDSLPLGPFKRGKLSIGMSDDLEIALATGTSCLRIGTALFGPRLPKSSQG